MATAAELQVRDRVFIGGEWVQPSGNEPIEVINATTEEVMGTVPACSPEDADRAVRAAREAFPAWSQTSREERAGYMSAIAAGLGERSEEIAATISQELGMPLKLSQMIQVGLPTAQFGAMQRLIGEIAWEEEIGNSRVLREPVGVVGAITPWNYPLNQIACKVAPALATGCTVVLKPSEVTPLNAFLLAEVIEAVGLPAGVFNLVTGTGPVVGEAIAAHPGVDMVSFTGSTRAGKRVSELASATVKPVAMELGGKSPNLILDDADLSRAVPDGVAKCYLNSGQTCSALTRMLVPREKLAEAEQIAAATAEAFTPGDPFAETTRLGPLVSDVQRQRVRGYIEKGEAEGAKLVTGGAEAPDGLLRRNARDDDRPRGDLRPGAGDPALRRARGRRADRQRQRLRPRRRRLGGRSRAGDRRRQADPDRPDRDQRRRLQPPRPVRRLRAKWSRPRERAVWAGGVSAGQESAAVTDSEAGRDGGTLALTTAGRFGWVPLQPRLEPLFSYRKDLRPRSTSRSCGKGSDPCFSFGRGLKPYLPLS